MPSVSRGVAGYFKFLRGTQVPKLLENLDKENDGIGALYLQVKAWVETQKSFLIALKEVFISYTAWSRSYGWLNYNTN